MTIRLANHSPRPFRGWVRTTTDKLPLWPSGEASGANEDGDVHYCRYVLGRRTGLDTHAIDVHCELASGEKVEVDFGVITGNDFALAPLPTDPLAHFGGSAKCNGVTLDLISCIPDGAGYLSHARGRVGRMFTVELWLVWYPDQPSACHGEALVTCSNPAVEDMGEVTPPEGLVLTVGDAYVLPLQGWPRQLVEGGVRFADGQSRLVPLSCLWIRHIRQGDGFVDITHSMRAVGITNLLHDGNPLYPPGYDPMAWTREMLPRAIQRIHTFDVGVVGPNKQSRDAGEQEDSVFKRGEALLPGGVGADLVAYLSAAKMAARPCHHRNADGSPLSPDGHSPRLVFWDGRPHWHTGVSPNQLGKPRQLTVDETHGWWGPDGQHWFINTLAAGCRLTGSPGLQSLLRAQAVIYLLQATHEAGWSTSGIDSARSLGWEGILAVHLWRELEDREMAERVRAHWVQRWNRVGYPACRLARENFLTGWWIDLRLDDPRLGSGWWSILWQLSVCAYGLDLAGRAFTEPSASLWAEMYAKQVLADGWVQGGPEDAAPADEDAVRRYREYCDAELGQQMMVGAFDSVPEWTTRAVAPIAGGGHHDGSFNYYGMPLCIAVVLRYEPQNEKAHAIWTYLQANLSRSNQAGWMAPGVTL